MRHGALDSRYTRNRYVRGLTIACIFGVLVGGPSCRERQATPESSEADSHSSDLAAPDLSQCARIEIRYHPSAIGYFLSGGLDPSNLLSPEEHQYLLSLEKAVITDADARQHRGQVLSCCSRQRGAGTKVVERNSSLLITTAHAADWFSSTTTR